jgi:hypothetical protein
VTPSISWRCRTPPWWRSKAPRVLAYAEIELPIPTAQVLAAEAVRCLARWLTHCSRSIALCFVVPSVPFKVVSERLLPARLL